MKMLKVFALLTLSIALVAAAAPSVQASAASSTDANTVDSTITWVSQTVTISEAQVNSLYRVTNPKNRALTNVYVHIQTGQVSIDATITEPGKAPLDTTSVWQPYLVRGVIDWRLISATSNGQPVPQSTLNALKIAHHAGLRDTFINITKRLFTPGFYVTNVSLTPGVATVTARVRVLTTATPTATPAQ